MTRRKSQVRLPTSLEDLWQVWADLPDAVLYTGGTDLLVKRRKGLVPEDANLICLERLSELQEITDEGETVVIGAGCSLDILLHHPLVRSCFPVLIQALQVLGSPPIRHMASVGGNICTASPAGDCLPPLYVLAAEVELQRASERRRMPIDAFITSPGRIDLKPAEILRSIRIRKQPEYNRQHYEKVGQRNALSISIAALAVAARISPQQIIENIRLAWGSVGPTIVRSRAVERELTGKRLELRTLKNVFPLVEQAVSPIDDVRASAGYRRTLAKNLLLRLVCGGHSA